MSKMWNENTIHAFRALINVVVYFIVYFFMEEDKKRDSNKLNQR